MRRFLDPCGPRRGWNPKTCTRALGRIKNQSYFIIYENQAPIGNAGLADINHAHRTAEFFIMIGDKESWGKGIGTEVTGLMLDFGFTCLGLAQHLPLGTRANERGIRAYRRAGFRMAGRLRQCSRLGGRAYDEILMDCLATEFKSGALRHLLPDSAGVEK